MSRGVSRGVTPPHLSSQVPGGYFVRQQDGELKYMVVFKTPEVYTEL